MRTALWIIVAVALTPRATSAQAPKWLEDAARIQPPPALAANTDAVVLHDDLTVTVGEDGRTSLRRQYAVRVLSRAGRSAAVAQQYYTTDAGEVREMRGWLLTDGIVTRLSGREVLDVAVADGDLYNEARIRIVTGAERADRGSVFGAEIELTERVPFTQLEWLLQERWPVLSVRRTLSLPRGWDARSVTFNAAPIEPTRNANVLTWAAGSLAAPPDEPSGPPLTALVPRLAVTYFPSGLSAPLDTWDAVARWLASLAVSAGNPTAALSAKAREVTAGATDDLDRIRRIAAYAQKIQYVSIQLGIGRGGGYTPRPAADVLARNYGDCKDKANLMRAMLTAVGVRSYLAATYAGDADYVRQEWASPQQFNHMILAIAIDTATPASVRNDRLGPLLFFDPTDEHTPLGELPAPDQGSLALIIAEGGPLVRLPESPDGANGRIRRINASIDTSGSLAGQAVHTSRGTDAVFERAALALLTRDEYAQRLETAMRRQIAGASIRLVEVTDDAAANRFELTLKLQAPRYAQIVQNRILVVRPPRALESDLPSLPATTRRSVVVLEPRHEEEMFELELAAGLTVDELPEAHTMETTFGAFSVHWQAQERHVVRKLSIRVKRQAVPPAAYGELRRFIEAFQQAEALPVVLVLR